MYQRIGGTIVPEKYDTVEKPCAQPFLILKYGNFGVNTCELNIVCVPHKICDTIGSLCDKYD